MRNPVAKLKATVLPGSSVSNYRLCQSDALRRVQFGKIAQALGFTLEEVKEILGLRGQGRAPCRGHDFRLKDSERLAKTNPVSMRLAERPQGQEPRAGLIIPILLPQAARAHSNPPAVVCRK